MNKLYTWREFDKDCETLALDLKRYGKMIKNVYGVPRGGLVIAVKLSHLLSIPVVLQKKDITADTLVVDDICDTGATLNELLKNKRFFRIVTLFMKNPCDYPVMHLHEKKAEWIIYPWETAKSSKYDGTTNRKS